MSEQQQPQQVNSSGPGGAVEQLTYAASAMQPDAIASNTHTSMPTDIQSMEMAPPSFTPDVARSEDPMIMDDNHQQFLPIAPPPSNNNIMSSNNNNNGKVCMDVETNEMKVSSSANLPPPTPSSTAALMNDTIERIVNAAESREASARESSLVNGGSSSSSSPGQGGEIFESSALHGGPFTSLELSQLSLHCCTSSSYSSNNTTITNNTKANNNVSLGEWSTIDGDLLATLTPMLQSHVTSALGIDLVGEGRNVIAKSMEGENGNGNKKKNGGKRPVITIQQVRCMIMRGSIDLLVIFICCTLSLFYSCVQ